jgi:hypothetical protein
MRGDYNEVKLLALFVPYPTKSWQNLLQQFHDRALCCQVEM